jgi:hypothetical protein
MQEQEEEQVNPLRKVPGKCKEVIPKTQKV